MMTVYHVRNHWRCEIEWTGPGGSGSVLLECYTQKHTLLERLQHKKLNGMNRFIVFSIFFYFSPSYHILLRLTMHVIHSRVGAFISRYKSKQHW